MSSKKHDLKALSTRAPEHLDKEKIKLKTQELRQRMYDCQRMLYAQQKYSVLVILQGLDASGKNSAIKRIFAGVNPIGCKVYGFKEPTPAEAGHDFLWRVHKTTPPHGMIHIHNRSHYEDILVPTVYKTHPVDLIEKRYRHINDFERLLSDHNTHILKFYLHLSKEEQEIRLVERLDERRSNWKHNDGDRQDRKKWDSFIDVYQNILTHTNTRHAPWHVIPADQKWYAAYEITKKILDTLENKMQLKWPKLETELFADEADE